MRVLVAASGKRPRPAAVLSTVYFGFRVAGMTQVIAGSLTIHFRKNCAHEAMLNSAVQGGNCVHRVAVSQTLEGDGRSASTKPLAGNPVLEFGTLLSMVISHSPGVRSSTYAAGAKVVGMSNKTMSVFFMITPHFRPARLRIFHAAA